MVDIVEDKRKVIIYAGNDVSTLKTLNRTVPGMLAMGLTPVIAFPEIPKMKKKFQSAALDEFAYFDRVLLNKVIIPAMDSYQPLRDRNGNPKSNIYYTPRGLTEVYPGVELYTAEADDGTLTSVNSPEHLAYVKKDPSIIGGISLRCLQIFQQDIIDALSENDGFLCNLHPGRLPYIRGVLPVFRAMASRDQVIDTTLHRILDKEIDRGAVIDHWTQEVEYDKSVMYHYNSGSKQKAALLLRFLGDYLAGRHERKVKNSAKGQYFHPPKANEIKEFTDHGGKMIDSPIPAARKLASDFTNGSFLKEPVLAEVLDAVRKRFDLERPVRRASANDVSFRRTQFPQPTVKAG